VTTSIGELRERFEAEGQGHVFAFWDELGEAARRELAREARAVDLDLVRELGELAAGGRSETAVERFEPPELFPLERDAGREREAREAARRGAEVLREGRVGFVVVAGGQGSRLGFEGPKGKFPAGPVSGRSLFEWHARRLLAARERHASAMPWYVMTSATNDAETRAFFELHAFFGLPPEDVFFFQQRMLPALDAEGRIVMRTRGNLFLAPNGHGGTLEALAVSGGLADAARRGIEHLSYFQVDNPLGRPADPLFLGLHVLAGARMSSKVVEKREPWEKVGVIGRADGRLGCIEYSDLPAELRDARDAEGRLLFRAGNIAAHVIDRGFVEELVGKGARLPWHIARKEVPAIDARGAPCTRAAVKFETFVFDALGHAGNSVTLEVERELEFSPVKNARGPDSPETMRRDLTRMFAAWLRAVGAHGAGVAALESAGENGSLAIEVDPTFAEDPEQFRARMPAEPERHERGILFR